MNIRNIETIKWKKKYCEIQLVKLLINTQLQIEGEEKEKKKEEEEEKLKLIGDETPSNPKLKYSKQLHRLISAE